MFEIIPDAKDIDSYLKLAEENLFAFEYNDFFETDILDDKDKLDKRISFYLSLGRDTSNDTLHGAFFDVIHFSFDKKIRNVALDRMKQSVDIAQRLSCKGVVFHTNFNPMFLKNSGYEKQWLECSVKAVDTLIRDSSNVEIYFENMFDTTYKQLKDLADYFKDERRFGICLDIAHLMLGDTDVEE